MISQLKYTSAPLKINITLQHADSGKKKIWKVEEIIDDVICKKLKCIAWDIREHTRS